MKGTDQLVAFLREILGPYFLTQDAWQASGTWTPGLAGAVTTGSFTFSTQAGRWNRYGQIVIARASLVIATIPVAPAGGMRMTGLPFTVVNAAMPGDCFIGAIGTYNYSPGALELTARPVNNQTYIQFLESFDNAAFGAAPATSFSVGSTIQLTCVYEAG